MSETRAYRIRLDNYRGLKKRPEGGMVIMGHISNATLPVLFLVAFL